MTIRLYILLLMLLIFKGEVFSQQVIPVLTRTAASAMRKDVEFSKNPEEKAEQFLRLAHYYLALNNLKRQRYLDSAKIYLALGSDHARTAGYKPGMVFGEILRGEYWYILGKGDSARFRFNKALVLSKSYKNSKLEGIAWFYRSKTYGRYKESALALSKSAICFKAGSEAQLLRITLNKIRSNYHQNNYMPYRITFRSTDSMRIAELKKQLKSRIAGKDLSEICLELCAKYTFRKGNALKNADSIFYFADMAENLATVSRVKAVSGETALWRGLAYYRQDDYRKIDRIISGATDSVKYILWLTLANHYYARPAKDGIDEIGKDSSVYYYKLAFLHALRKKDKFMIKASVDGLIRTGSTYVAGWNPTKSENIYKFIQSHKLKGGYPSDVNLNYRLYNVYISKGRFADAMRCALVINKLVSPDSISMFRYMKYYTMMDINYWIRNYAESNIYVEGLLNDRPIYEDGYASIYEAADGYYENMRYLHQVEKVIPLIDRIYSTNPPATSRDTMSYHLILGKSYTQLKNYELAETNLKKAIEVARRINANLNNLQSYLAAVYFLKGDFAGAKKLMDKELLKPVPSETYRSSLYNWGAKVDSALTNYESAYKWLTKSQDLSDSLYNRENDSHVRELAYLQESQLKEGMLALNTNRIAELKARTLLFNQKAKVRKTQIAYHTLLKQRDSTKLLMRDKSIQLLRQSRQERIKELGEAKSIKKIFLLAVLLLAILVVFVFIYLKNKRRVGKVIAEKNDQMERLLDEKSLLLKEMHHRVKNNLHMVISLLDAQAPSLKDNALAAVRNSQHKIFAMSLIHQKLYQTEDLKTINMGEYIIELVGYLKEGFDGKHLVRFHYELDHVALDVAGAVQLALIIDEVIAFFIRSAPTESHVNFQIELIAIGKDGYCFILEGLNAGLGNRESLQKRGLDLALIDELAQKLNAGVRIDTGNPGRFVLTAPSCENELYEGLSAKA